jgi:hypothetical protein
VRGRNELSRGVGGEAASILRTVRRRTNAAACAGRGQVLSTCSLSTRAVSDDGESEIRPRMCCCPTVECRQMPISSSVRKHLAAFMFSSVCLVRCTFAMPGVREILSRVRSRRFLCFVLGLMSSDNGLYWAVQNWTFPRSCYFNRSAPSRLLQSVNVLRVS